MAKKNKEAKVHLHLDVKLRGLQFVCGERMFFVMKRRLKASRGKFFVSEDGGLIIYFTTTQVPWIGMMDPSIRGNKIQVSPAAMDNFHDWRIEDALIP